MKVEVLESLDACAAVAADWNRLAEHNPMVSYDWLEAWWRHYRPGGELMVLAVRDARDRLAGLAPWRAESSPHRGRVVRWLGDGDVCSDHLTLLVDRDGETPTVSAAVADHLAETASDWDLLRLDDCDQGDPRIEAMTDALAARGFAAAERPAGACWVIDLPGDWEAFLAMQSKSHRKQLRRSIRAQVDTGKCEWAPVETAEQLRSAWPVLIDLHQRRRISLGEPGCFACDRFAAFHAEVSQRLLASGKLRVSVLRLDGRPAAAEYQFAGSRAVFAYQGGVEPARLEDGPGQLSLVHSIQHALNSDATTFDLLRGDEPYKAHWRATPRPTFHLRVVPPRRTAVARAQAGELVGVLKRGLKSLRAGR